MIKKIQIFSWLSASFCLCGNKICNTQQKKSIAINHSTAFFLRNSPAKDSTRLERQTETAGNRKRKYILKFNYGVDWIRDAEKKAEIWRSRVQPEDYKWSSRLKINKSCQIIDLKSFILACIATTLPRETSEIIRTHSINLLMASAIINHEGTQLKWTVKSDDSEQLFTL